MPTYDYKCTKCNHSLEAFQKMSDDPLKVCPQCSKEGLLRVPSKGVGLAFKGNGFYITDYGPNRPAEKSGSCCPCGSNKGSCSSKKE
jgi:putative FmdB family regulatory protein